MFSHPVFLKRRRTLKGGLLKLSRSKEPRKTPIGGRRKYGVALTRLPEPRSVQGAPQCHTGTNTDLRNMTTLATSHRKYDGELVKQMQERIAEPILHWTTKFDFMVSKITGLFLGLLVVLNTILAPEK